MVVLGDVAVRGLRTDFGRKVEAYWIPSCWSVQETSIDFEQWLRLPKAVHALEPVIAILLIIDIIAQHSGFQA